MAQHYSARPTLPSLFPRNRQSDANKLHLKKKKKNLFPSPQFLPVAFPQSPASPMETEGRCTGAMTSQQCVRREVAVGRLRRLRKEARQRFLIRSITSWGKLAGLSSFEGCFPLSLKGATGFSCSEAVSHSLVNKSGCESESEARRGLFWCPLMV